MTARLPNIDGDENDWGDVLNAFLLVAHANDGTLNPNVVGTLQLQNNSVANANLDSSTQAIIASVAGKYVKPSTGIPGTDLDSSTQASLSLANSALQTAPVSSVAGKTGAVTLAETDIASLTGDLAAAEKTANKNQPSGYAGLNGSGQLSVALLPANALSLAGSTDVNISSPSNGQALIYSSSSSKWINQELLLAASSPATTVTGPDAFGAANAVGTSTLYARQDHDHGLPAAPTHALGDLALTGGTMSGAIAMGGNKITALANPTNAADAANKQYVDTILGLTIALG